MKKTLVLLLLCCSIFQANAAIFVSGIISSNTTWTKANSPYIVNGNLSVDSAVTLTIQPGVEVLVDSGYTFNVDGALLAIGTTTDTIKFTSSKPSPSHKAWSGITFTIKGKKDTSRIKYCLFTYGSQPIRNVNTNVYINNSVFRYNTTAITVFGAPSNIYPYSYYESFIVIKKCLVTANDTGMYDTGYGYWNINSNVSENEISYNNIGMKSESESGLIFTYNNFNYNVIGYWAIGNDQRGSNYNNFKGNSMYGIYATYPASTIGSIGRICDNSFIYNAKAVCLDNVAAGNLYNNIFAYNDIGIHFNYPLSSTGSFIGPGYFINCFSHNTSYNVKNNSAKTIRMSSSWWGTASTAGIDSTIYDGNDNSSLGIIDYSNYKTTLSCQPVSPPPPCLQPDSLTADITSSTTATVTWPAVAGAPAYEYYVIPITATPPSSGTLTRDTILQLTGITPGQTYKVCVRTRCAAPPFASAWVCDTIMTPCNTPTELMISSVNAFNAIVSWDTVAGVREYEYYVLPHPSTPPVNPTVTTNHTIYLTSLSMNTTYDICIRSKCPNSYSAWVCDTFTTKGTGIPQTPVDRAISIYPNPNNGTFNVSLNKGYGHAAVTVFDMTGRMVASKQMNTANETISLGSAAKGIYNVRIVTDNAVVNKRIVIE